MNTDHTLLGFVIGWVLAQILIAVVSWWRNRR